MDSNKFSISDKGYGIIFILPLEIIISLNMKEPYFCAARMLSRMSEMCFGIQEVDCEGV